MYMRHHAIIVTGHLMAFGGNVVNPAEEAHAIASKIFARVSPLIPSDVNGYWTFFVPPDGYSETADESDDGDMRRKEFLAWLDEFRLEDGSPKLQWVEVQYGDDQERYLG